MTIDLPERPYALLHLGRAGFKEVPIADYTRTTTRVYLAARELLILAPLSDAYRVALHELRAAVDAHRALIIGETQRSDMDNEATARALQKPGIGRIVHVVGVGEFQAGKHLPAIITAVGPEVLEVTAFLPGSPPIATSVGVEMYGDEPGCWHWPERV